MMPDSMRGARFFPMAAGAALALVAATAVAHKGGHAHDEQPHEHDARAAAAPAAAMEKGASPAAEVYIISPANGAEVSSPVRVRFGLRGMGVAPAGADLKNTGHHHLLIDLDEVPNLEAPLPANDNVRHFGGGQTEALIELEPGKHTLQLLLGDYLHRPHNPPVMSEKIEIVVKGVTPL